MATLPTRASPLGDIQSLLDIFKGKSQTTTSTTGEVVSPEKTNAIIQQILQGPGGLAALGAGQRAAGVYNSSTTQLLSNDLLARAASQAALASTTKTTTQTTQQNPQLTPKNVTNLLGGLATSTALRVGAKKLGIKTPEEYLSNGIDYLNGTVFPGSVQGINSIGADAGLSGYGSAPVDTGLLQDTSFLSAAESGSSIGSDAGLGSSFGAGLGFGVGLGSLGDIGGTAGSLTPGGYAIAAGDTAFGSAAAAEGVSAAAGAADTAGTLGDLSWLDSIGSSAGAEAGADAALGSSGVGLPILAVKLAGQALGIKEINNVFSGVEGAVGDVVSGVGNAVGGVVSSIGDALGWIVCTELNKQGRMPDKWYVYGAMKFTEYDNRVKQGYYYWAPRAVIELRTRPYSLVSRSLEWIFNQRAQYIAASRGCKRARKTLVGWAVSGAVYISCWILSRTLARDPSTIKYYSHGGV